MTDPKEILVPLDFSEASDQALACAQQYAKSFDARLHVLHVIPDPHSEAWSIEATGMNLGGPARDVGDRGQAASRRSVDGGHPG